MTPSYFSKGAAWLRIFFLVLSISGSAWLLFFAYSFFWNARAKDPRYTIVAILQTGPEKEALKTSFLAELLSLSTDSPTNLYQFDLSLAKQKLLKFPLIKEAQLKRIPPGTLYIDYTIRKPIAYIADRKNTAIDSEGVLIPFKPFFSPKKLPEVKIGLKDEKLVWGDKLSDPNGELAFRVLHCIKKWDLPLIALDVSKADKESLGEEKIILTLEKGDIQSMTSFCTLVLNREKFEENLNRFKNLMEYKKEILIGSKILDFRIDNLAYIRSGER